MARTIRNTKLDTRSARASLTMRREPYWTVITGGCAVGYRKGKKGGTKELAIAENSNVILKGLLSYDRLEPSAKFRFDTLMHMLFNTLESTISSVDSEFVVDEVMVNVKSYLNRFFAYPGMFEWWDQAETEFLGPLREWINHQFPGLEPKSDYWGLR